MRILRERVKNPRARKGCLPCYNIGAAAPTFAYVEVEYVPMRLGEDGKPVATPIIKEVGLCFAHCKQKTEKNPGGFLDPEIGLWKKTPFGKMPVRDEVYSIVGGRTNGRLLTGVCGKIPLWWIIPLMVVVPEGGWFWW